MIQELASRKGKNIVDGKIRCFICGHENTDLCRCQQCVMELYRQAKDEQIRLQEKINDAIITEQLKHLHINFSLKDISLDEAVAFLALSRCCSIDSEFICGPLAESSVPYAPTTALTNELLNLLRHKGLITVSEQSAKGTVDFDGELISYDMQNVKWAVPSECAHVLIEEIERAGLSGLWPEHWYNQAQPFWQNLALSECRQFYDYCAKARGLHAQGDLAVNAMLTNLLRDFSVGQVYRSIWNGATSASDFLVRNKVNRAHAANFMVGATQRWADRARAEGWQVIAFKRNFDLPRSMISYVLFDVILKIGDRGFTEVIYKENMSF